MTIGERIKKQRQKKNYTLEKLADEIGVTKSTILKYENGLINIPSDKIEKVSKALNISPSYLMGWDDNIETKISMSIPILGKIACGQPLGAVENLEWIDIEEKCDYGLIAEGDSMIGAGIYNGDLVLLDKAEHLDNGEIGAVCVGEDITLKKFYNHPEKNRIVLRAANPDYEDMIFDDEELKDIRIIGRMKRLTRKY